LSTRDESIQQMNIFSHALNYFNFLLAVVTGFMLTEPCHTDARLQAVALLTRCLKGDLVPSKDERGFLLLQLGRHLQDLGLTSQAIQVNFTC